MAATYTMADVPVTRSFNFVGRRIYVIELWVSVCHSSHDGLKSKFEIMSCIDINARENFLQQKKFGYVVLAETSVCEDLGETRSFVVLRSARL